MGEAAKLPEETVAAITAALAAFLGEDPKGLRVAVRGEFPLGRADAGAYHLAGRIRAYRLPSRGGKS